MSNFRLTKRDYLIFNEINRWRVITGKQICIVASFSSPRTCDRRLKKLIEAKFLTRQKIIYGIPNIYSLTHWAKILKWTYTVFYTPLVDKNAEDKQIDCIHRMRSICVSRHIFHLGVWNVFLIVVTIRFRSIVRVAKIVKGIWTAYAALDKLDPAHFFVIKRRWPHPVRGTDHKDILGGAKTCLIQVRGIY